NSGLFIIPEPSNIVHLNPAKVLLRFTLYLIVLLAVSILDVLTRLLFISHLAASAKHPYLSASVPSVLYRITYRRLECFCPDSLTIFVTTHLRIPSIADVRLTLFSFSYVDSTSFLKSSDISYFDSLSC